MDNAKITVHQFLLKDNVTDPQLKELHNSFWKVVLDHNKPDPAIATLFGFCAYYSNLNIEDNPCKLDIESKAWREGWYAGLEGHPEIVSANYPSLQDDIQKIIQVYSEVSKDHDPQDPQKSSTGRRRK